MSELPADTPACTCAGPGHCPRRGGHVTRIGWRLCRGDALSWRDAYFGGGASRRREPPELATHLAPVRHADGTAGRAVDRAWEGTVAHKPWQYRASVAVVHLDSPDLLAAALDLWRLQSERPYLIVVDTGSLPAHQATLDAIEAAHEDVEVHRLRPRAWRSISQPVAAAMDVAFAVCQTEFLIASHTDVFPTRRDLAGWITGQCDARTPLVGWQMSPRTAWPDESWKDIPSHTCTAYHMPTARRLGWRWNMLEAFDRLGVEPHQPHRGFPDTEVTLGMILAEQGITPRWHDRPDDGGTHWLCLGGEDNAPYSTDWFVHQRNTTVQNLYGRAGTQRRLAELGRVVGAARDRAAAWRADDEAAERDRPPDLETASSPPAEPPGLLQQAASLVRSTARHVAAGCPTAGPRERQARLAICRECPEFDDEKTRCRACGCRLRTKAAWALEACPLGKW